MAKTKHHRTAHPLAAMLPGSFATELENRFADLNNLLALQGVLTSDPIAIALSGIRRGARDLGVTFERVVPTAAVTAPVAAPKVTAPKASTTPAAKPTKAAKAEAAPATTKQRKARVIKEEQIEALQVAGSISEAAPYGTDEDGRPLAPYGVKNDGTPMKRRGRTASAKSEAAPARAEVAEVAAPAVEEASEAAPSSGETEVPAGDDLDTLLEGL